jgi:hypothetical protein
VAGKFKFISRHEELWCCSLLSWENGFEGECHMGGGRQQLIETGEGLPPQVMHVQSVLASIINKPVFIVSFKIVLFWPVLFCKSETLESVLLTATLHWFFFIPTFLCRHFFL